MTPEELTALRNERDRLWLAEQAARERGDVAAWRQRTLGLGEKSAPEVFYVTPLSPKEYSLLLACLQCGGFIA